MPPRVYRNAMKRRRRGPRKGYRSYRKGRLRSSYKSVASFRRTKQLSSIVLSTSAIDTVYKFQLSDLDNSSEFTSLYDLYKIKCVVLKFIPMFNSNDMNAQSSAYAVPPIHSVIDYTDTTPLATVADALQYSTHRMTRGLAIHTRKVYPKQVTYSLDDSVSTLASVKTGWIRAESPGIDHLGVKLFIPNTGATATTSVYQVFATYYLQCKNIK